MSLLTINGETLDRLGFEKKPRGIHWIAGTDRYKLTTPLDLLKRRLRRYYVTPAANDWRGGQVPTFARLKSAKEAARAVSTWGYGPTRVVSVKWNRNPEELCRFGKP